MILLLPLASDVPAQIGGGKASVLSTLLRRGLPVPDGRVLTVDAFTAFLSLDGLGGRIDRALSETASAGADGAATAIRDMVNEASIPPAVLCAIRSACCLLSLGPVVVRSSAVGEDGHGSSFAGQFDSVIDVSSEHTLIAAVKACWASYWSARALFYRHSRELPAARMAVLIQRQVHATAAGVLFTVAPETARTARSRMVLEYTSGLADQLVSGRIDPGRLYVSRDDFRSSSDAESENPFTRDLVHRHAEPLARLGLQLEGEMGGPQDIEWTIDANERLWIVQARPITTLGSSPILEAKRAARIVWSNANVSENFPEPVSPLLYSIASSGYYHYFRNLGLAFGVSRRRLEAMDPAFRTIVGVHGARLYYNLTNIHAVLRLMPFGARLSSAFDLFVGARESTQASPHGESWAARRDRWRQAVEALRIAASVFWQMAFLEQRLRRFEETADAFASHTTHAELSTCSLSALGDRLAEFVGIRCHRWKNASLCDAAAMLADALLGRVLRSGGFDDAARTRLLRAIPGAPSSEPALRLWSLSREVRRQPALRQLVHDTPPELLREALARRPEFSAFTEALEAHLTTWGFRSSGELMLTLPTLEERPEPAFTLLRQYAASDGDDPRATIRGQAARRRVETRTILWHMARRAPHLCLPFLVLLHWTHRAIVARERARLKQALLYTRCRAVARAIGSRLAAQRRVREADDVFMLTWPELDEICAGRAMFPAGLHELVAMRRSLHETASAEAPPDTIRLAEDEIPTSWRREDTSGSDANASTLEQPAIGDLVGVTACGGRISAPAAVLAGVHESDKLSRGDVLVTRQTDPGWAPVFCLVSGLVIERGGMLSHGAIIAREFGLPCLVGVTSATRRIAHGAWLALDADRGVCRIEAAR